MKYENYSGPDYIIIIIILLQVFLYNILTVWAM